MSDNHDHGSIGHVTPLPLLFGVWGALMVLTIVTVAATFVDLGGQWNLIVAMVIATIKAGLVVAYFMHLRWDSGFNGLAFLGSVLFVGLFISIALLDKSEYEDDVIEYQNETGQHPR